LFGLFPFYFDKDEKKGVIPLPISYNPPPSFPQDEALKRCYQPI